MACALANITPSSGRFSAPVTTKLTPTWRTAGFVKQIFLTAEVASFAAWLPLLFPKYGVTASTASGIPLTVKYAFQLGAVAFLVAVIYTVVTSKEYPPEDLEAFRRKKQEKQGIAAGFNEIVEAIREMPQTMKQLAGVQLFTWLGLFCMWLFYVPAVARHGLCAADPRFALPPHGVAWGNFTFSFYSITCFANALALPWLSCQPGRHL